MKVLEPGHLYDLFVLDNSAYRLNQYDVVLRFVKRVGENYPGNGGSPYPGTNIQEVLRVVIDRTQYLQGQVPCWQNGLCLYLYRWALNLLEWRAANRHNRVFRWKLKPELLQFDPEDGHVRY